MEEGQPGSPKDFNRTGNPAIGTLSWQSFQERDPTGYRKLVTSVMRDDFTEVAMKCADSSDRWSKLREAAFNHLAALKGDSEVEQYFIGYFVDVETGYESDVLTDIANSFWS